MANSYKNAAVVLSSTGSTNLYTCPAATRAIVQSVNVANIDGSDRYVTITWYDSSSGSSYTLLNNALIPSGTAMNAISAAVVLEAGDIIRCQAVTANTLHVTASILEQDPTSAFPEQSVTTTKIADSAVTSAKMATGVSPAIICTSSTRPSSPFAGQQIYETNTSRYWTYSTWSQWVPNDMVFATESARDTAIPNANATEGMRAYITAPTVPAATGASGTAVPTGVQTIYNGSVWVCVTEIGANATAASQSLTTSYSDLAVSATNTSVTLVTGTSALVMMSARATLASNFCTLNVKTGTVSAATHGASTPGTTGYGVAAKTFVMTGLTAGTNTFTLIGVANVAGGSFDQHTLAVRGIA